jgi:hypothetical protein
MYTFMLKIIWHDKSNHMLLWVDKSTNLKQFQIWYICNIFVAWNTVGFFGMYQKLSIKTLTQRWMPIQWIIWVECCKCSSSITYLMNNLTYKFMYVYYLEYYLVEELEKIWWTIKKFQPILLYFYWMKIILY